MQTETPWWRRPLDLLLWTARHEFITLALLGVVACGVWVFIEIADEVAEGETHQLDQTLLLALRNPADPSDPIGPDWVEEMGRDFTALGGIGIQALITLGMAGALLLYRKRRAALLVLVAVAGGVALSLLLKQGFERPRPDLVPHGSYTYTSSFPSGHSMTAAVTYLTLGALLMRLLPGEGVKLYFFLFAGLITLLTGLSRVYLGVHWPTDVLAGWTAGFAWAVLCWTITRKLQVEGQVEEEYEVTEDLESEKDSPTSP